VRVRVDPLRHGGDVTTDQVADVRGYRGGRGWPSSVTTYATLPLQQFDLPVPFAIAGFVGALFHGSLLLVVFNKKPKSD
jgi:hypothetical protein